MDEMESFFRFCRNHCLQVISQSDAFGREKIMTIYGEKDGVAHQYTIPRPYLHCRPWSLVANELIRLVTNEFGLEREEIKGMSELKGEVVLKSGEYRPCMVDGKKALFHKWIDSNQILLKFEYVCKSEKQAAILEDFKKNLTVPHGVTPEVVRVTKALVEFEDGTVKEVLPIDMIFLDGKNLFSEYAAFGEGF